MIAAPDTTCPTCGATTPCECPDRRLVYVVPPNMRTPPQPFPKADKARPARKAPPDVGDGEGPNQ